MPIIVSRVAPETPADLAIPRLNEGDQVLYINGRDVSQHTHEQVRVTENSLFICSTCFLLCFIIADLDSSHKACQQLFGLFL